MVLWKDQIKESARLFWL